MNEVGGLKMLFALVFLFVGVSFNVMVRSYLFVWIGGRLEVESRQDRV